MESIWELLNENKDHAHVHAEAKHWDIIVIGAGMAGILTAYYLKQEGKSVLVLEADEVASGQTKGTTAKITSQHDVKYSKLIKTVGRETARSYACANEEAIQEYENLIRKESIDCQFERCSSYLYTLQDTKKLEEEAEAAQSLGIDADFTIETELPFPVAGAVCFRNQARFSPLQFIQHLSRQLEIEEHTKAIDVKGKMVITDKGSFTADNIVVAAHYPFIDRYGFYFLRQHQERSYVLALSGCKKLDGMYLGIDPDGISLRQSGEYILLGGASHRTGKNECGGVYRSLEEMAKQYFPDYELVTKWSAQDCMPHDGIPFIGKYCIFTPNLYVITGFQKWGMTSSMVAAMILRDELCGKINPYAKTFSPQRLHLRAGLKNMMIDIGVSTEGLIKGLFHRKRSCPHMGCELSWNPDERTWECPCHGSRFNADGNLMDNPALRDKRKD